MGNTESQTNKNQVSSLEDSSIKPRHSLEQNLIYLKTLHNENYGEVKIMSIKGESDQNFYALKVFRANDANSMKKIYQEAINRKDLTLDTVVKIKEVRFDEANLFCSDHFKVLVLLEYFELTLKDEIQRRKQKNLHFSEIELFNLIDCVLSALILFDQKGISHEDVSPGTIFLTPNHIFKLNDINFLTEGLNAYKKFLMGAVDAGECYLSPELLLNLKHRTLNPEHYNKQKSDVFSLGMTTLEAAMLFSMKDCYDFDEFRIKPEIIALYLEEVKLRFSPNICELLKCMLGFDENHRPDYKDLYKLLAQELDQLKGNNENYDERLFELKDEKPIENEREEKKLKAEPFKENNNNDLDDLEGKISKVLYKSEETKKKYEKELEHSKHALMEDDFGELLAKREDFLSKSYLIKESIIRERDKKSSLDDEAFIDSNKLYEVYLEEYEKLKAMK